MRQTQEYNAALYPMYDFAHAAMALGNLGVSLCAEYQSNVLYGAEKTGLIPPHIADDARNVLTATTEMSERLSRDYLKPEFGLHETFINGEQVDVKEELVDGQDKPFGSLLHFERKTDRIDPKVLIVAPMSGHYATLLRDTVRQLLPSHDVYITDWRNAEDVPLAEGDFGLNDYIDYVQDWIREMGPETNVVAVCQSTVPVLAAISNMAEKDPNSQPLSMTLMGGPLDTKAAPTAVTEFAESKSIDWFKANMIGKVSLKHTGADRLVYPGFVQLTSFMGMNPQKHVEAQLKLYGHRISGDEKKAEKITAFYDEYLSVASLAGPYYLDTVENVFLTPLLPHGEMEYRGAKINPAAITETALLTIEGENDDIAAPGQTIAAHKWCTELNPKQQYHYLQEGVGHYGIFSGQQWGGNIAPRIAGFIRKTAVSRGLEYDSVDKQAKILSPIRWQPAK